jgi:23S rRNA (guanine745-N1)-methyltransferase
MRQAIAQFGAPGTVPLICPVCRQKCHLEGASLLCSNGHTFDISRHGSVDLRRKRVESQHYTRSFFTARQEAQRAGLYRQLTQVLSHVCATTGSHPLVDVGCGDGMITAAIGADAGVDISAEAIELASRRSNTIEWICADSNRLPFADHSVSTLVTIFAPTDYQEARRVSKTGLLIKVVPGSEHMKQLRSVLNISPARQHARSEDLLTHYAHVVQRYEVTETVPLTTDQARVAVAEMSPVSFGRLSHDPNQWSTEDNRRISEMTSITTDSVILVCNLK